MCASWASHSASDVGDVLVDQHKGITDTIDKGIERNAVDYLSVALGESI